MVDTYRDIDGEFVKVSDPYQETNIFDGVDKDLLKRFKAFHLKNKFVYQQFKDLAMKMKSIGGKDKYSGWVIINKIRWDCDIKTKGDVFKINNDFIALYVRLLIYHQPEFVDFFEMRKMKPFDRRSSDEERYRLEDEKN